MGCHDLCDLVLWSLTLTFCMDITSVNGNDSWKFKDDTMRGKLSKDVTNGWTSEMSVRRAVWSQLRSFRTIETNPIANIENEICCICIYYPGKTLLYGYYKELFVKNFEDRNKASRHVQNLSQSDVPISVFGILLHKMFVYCRRLFKFLFGRI